MTNDGLYNGWGREITSYGWTIIGWWNQGLLEGSAYKYHENGKFQEEGPYTKGVKQRGVNVATLDKMKFFEPSKCVSNHVM